MDLASLGFGEGFGVGAIFGSLLTKIVLQIWRNKVSKDAQRRKSLSEVCDRVWQMNNSLCVDAVRFYCTPFTREGAVKIKSQMGELANALTELNVDLDFSKKKELLIPHKEIIDLRQVVTLKVFEQRSINYQFTDDLINEIYRCSELLGSKIRHASRSLK